LCQLLFTVIDQFCVRLPVVKKRGRKLTYLAGIAARMGGT